MGNTNKILALDLGTTFGYTIGEIKEREKTCEIKNCQQHKSKGKGYVKTGCDFYDTLYACVEEEGISCIVFEEVLFGTARITIESYGLRAGICHIISRAFGLPEPVAIPVTTIRKRVFGIGNLPKNWVLTYLLRIYKDLPEDLYRKDNALDSLTLMLAFCKQHDYIVSLDKMDYLEDTFLKYDPKIC